MKYAYVTLLAFLPLATVSAQQPTTITLSCNGTSKLTATAAADFKPDPITNLGIIDRENLVGQAAKRGAYMQERLHEAFGDHPLVGQVRGYGLIAAVEFVASRSPLRAFDPGQRVAARVTAASRANGVLTRALPASDTIAFSPPFIVSESEIDEMVTVTRRALADVTAELGRD